MVGCRDREAYRFFIFVSCGFVSSSNLSLSCDQPFYCPSRPLMSLLSDRCSRKELSECWRSPFSLIGLIERGGEGVKGRGRLGKAEEEQHFQKKRPPGPRLRGPEHQPSQTPSSKAHLAACEHILVVATNDPHLQGYKITYNRSTGNGNHTFVKRQDAPRTPPRGNAPPQYEQTWDAIWLRDFKTQFWRIRLALFLFFSVYYNHNLISLQSQLVFSHILVSIILHNLHPGLNPYQNIYPCYTNTDPRPLPSLGKTMGQSEILAHGPRRQDGTSLASGAFQIHINRRLSDQR